MLYIFLVHQIDIHNIHACDEETLTSYKLDLPHNKNSYMANNKIASDQLFLK